MVGGDSIEIEIAGCQVHVLGLKGANMGHTRDFRQYELLAYIQAYYQGNTELKLTPRRACKDILRDPVRGTSCGCQEVYGSTGAPGMGRYAASGHSASCLSSTTARHHQCVCDLENPPATDPTIAAPEDEETPHST
ncbi:hypothetical protein J6590_088854 [Homalodisca vitripennis]|nr:hypothetical protein J6590_088854 [Homalodisca vitripennis]